MSKKLGCNNFRTGGKWKITEGKAAEDGNTKIISGVRYILFDRCWIHYYEPPEDTLDNRKALIVHLTRRTFHHTEPGINTPGLRLAEARTAYESELDPDKKRVNAAMLAGALFNHATDIFTAIAELGSKCVVVTRSNELMKECGACFKEALELGTQVKHFSGEEGIDELWGEPFRAFSVSVDEFYKSRYIKIAQTWHNIDRVCAIMHETFSEFDAFTGVDERINKFAIAAKCESETMKSDKYIFSIWPEFVATGEQLACYFPQLPDNSDERLKFALQEGHEFIKQGKNLINWIASARVPMPQSTSRYKLACKVFKDKLHHCYNLHN